MELLLSILTLSFSFFLLMDPIGNIPIYVAILKKIPPQRQRSIIFREMCIALFTILLFYFLGDALLSALHVSTASIQVSGGIILFLIALRMIFPQELKESDQNTTKKEPFIVPLAIPLVAGPTILAAVMVYSHSIEASHFVFSAAILIAWLASTLILVFSASIDKILGERGEIALERLMGFILTLIAVEMFLTGVKVFFFA